MELDQEHGTASTDADGTAAVWLRNAALALAFGLLYYAAFQMGMSFYFAPEKVATFWPASGLVLGVLLLCPYRLWPTVILIQAGVQFGLDLWDLGNPLTFAIFGTMAGTFSAVVSAVLIRRSCQGVFSLANLKHIVVLVTVTLLVESIGALMGATAVVSTYPDISFWSAWQEWCFADLIGVLLVTPAIVGCGTLTRDSLRQVSLATTIEACLMVAATATASHLIFSTTAEQYTSILDFPYLALPFLVWAAIRFHPRVAAWMLLMVGVFLIYHADSGRGPFIMPGRATQELVLAVQAFLSVCGLLVLILAAVIAERKAATEALQDSARQVRSLLDSTAEAIYGVDMEGNCIFCNPACLRMLGYERADQLLDKNMHKLTHHTRPDDTPYPMEECRIYQAFKLGKESHVDDEVLWRADGSSFLAEYWSFPVRDERNGEIVGCVVTFMDITERKRAETERETLIEKLEAQNAELERFTYTVSHDLKSPLITIGGYVGILRQDLESGDFTQADHDLTRISNATIKMERLLRDLLELSRIGRLVNPSEKLSLDELAHEAVEVLGRQIEKKAVEVEIATDMPPVYGDRLRLLEVLQNLIDNGIKYMGDQPSPRIEVGWRRDGDEVVYYVRDNGIGIDPDYHEKIFGLFDQLDPKAEGSGVGLSLVRRIIEVHGGRIWVESEGSGRGTTFCFTLAASDALQQTPTDLPHSASAVDASSGNANVLR